MDGKGLGSLTFGFDIGIASVGWCVLGENRIVDLGVRCFDPGEDNDGKPHNQARRSARVTRNRLRMRRWRLNQLLRLYCDVGLLSAPDPHLLIAPPRVKGEPDASSPWNLRAQGLERRLEPIEWARVLYYMVKHRGFEFFRKSEIGTPINPSDTGNTSASGEATNKEYPQETTTDEEKQRLTAALSNTRQLLDKYRIPYEKYRKLPLTVGALAFWLSANDQAPGEPCPDEKDRELFRASFRNKDRSYRHSFFREALRQELRALFAAQHRHGNPYTTLKLPTDGAYLQQMQANIPVGSDSRSVGLAFQEAVFDLFDLQHPPLYAEQIREMVGECELEHGYLRASKNAFSAERATWLEKLNHLRIRRDGPESLTVEERACLIDLPYEHRIVTLKLVRETLMVETGFPASWQEANFNAASYQAKPASGGTWIFIVTPSEEPVRLDKWAKDKDRKKRLTEAKKLLTGGAMTFKQLRELLQIAPTDRFIYRITDTSIVPRSLEGETHIPFATGSNGLLAAGETFQYIQTNGKTKILPKAAWKLAATLKAHSAPTLAEWRKVLASLPEMSGAWQFEHSKQEGHTVEVEAESQTSVPLQFEDAQAVEADFKLVELKGWHALRSTLAKQFLDKWRQLEVAYRNPRSDEGKNAAKDIDDIAEALTICQTDREIEQKLLGLGYTHEQIAALQTISFSKFRNLSLDALRKILPHLEDGYVYSKACELAGYSHSEKQASKRGKGLPPLATYVYQRRRHGKPTGHIEKRYKELRNPVVARSLNQARLVFNALVAKHGSPAYVHVETARDLARSKKLRDEIKKRQETSSKRTENIRNDLRNRLGHEPSTPQILKMRLYGEQGGQCIYTGKSLEPHLDSMLKSDDDVEIDHIWPRSKTFDNSLDNRVLVIAGANRDKGNRIPYEFLGGANGDARWREFEKRVLACKGISAEKQRRLLAKNLEDADEFLARNLVDTRYVTRLFANMLRERALFSGGASEEELKDILPDDDGKIRWSRYQRARVRTPQGRLVDFLRGKWGLAHAKDREKSDLHHALDACIIAACTPQVIQRVNTYFSEEEKEPGRHSFKRNPDGTYTHRSTGQRLSKVEARERGLYLPAPWDNFHRDLLTALDAVFISRRPKRKSAGELHDANPKAIRYLPVPLIDLTDEMLADEKLREKGGARRDNYETLREALNTANGDAPTAFAQGHEVIGKNGRPKRVHSIELPLWSLPADYLARRKKALAKSNKERDKEGLPAINEHVQTKSRVPVAARKTVPLTSLRKKMLTESELGSSFYQRNRELVLALRDQLDQYGDDPKKAFASPFRPPPSKSRKTRPIIRSIRLPESQGSGILVRGGIAGLGDSTCTEVYWTGANYFFRPRYAAREESMFGLEKPPAGAKHLFNLRIDEPIEVILSSGEVVPGGSSPGYFVVYEGDGRMRIRSHDRPGKTPRKADKADEEIGEGDIEEPPTGEIANKDHSLRRFSIKDIKRIRKFKVDIIGNHREVIVSIPHGLA